MAGAAWGMDTRLAWGLGIYLYLIPALSLPLFLLLFFFSVRTFSRAFWLIPLICPFAWYFGDRAYRVDSGWKPISDPVQIFGMFFNAFTILLIAIAIIIQLAAMCEHRASTIREAATA